MQPPKKETEEEEKMEISLDTGVLSYAGVKYKIIVVPILLSSFRNKMEINRIFSDDQKLGKFMTRMVEEYLKKADEEKAKGVG